jgi:GH24 family phage-related lysozyme (muramidase)
MANTSPSIDEQIQQTAGFYPPLVYDLLTRYSSLITNNDSDSTLYLPLTDVQPPDNFNTLPFVVGLIAPPLPTGRLISREASVASLSNTSPPGSGLASLNPGVSGAGGTATSLSPKGLTFIANHEGFSPNPYADPPGQDKTFSIGYGHQIQPGESFNPPITRAQGQQLLLSDTAKYQQRVKQSVSAPLTQNQFDALTSLAYNLGSVPRPIANALNSNNYDAAVGLFGQYVHDTTGAVNPALLARRQDEGVLFSKPDTPGNGQTSVQSDVPNEDSWNTQGGSSNAQIAAQQNDSVANQNLNQSDLGQQFFAQQQAQITDLTNRINQMAATPPLRLLVNPRSFKNSLEKITADGNWGRNGPIIEHWGENLDKIEGSGKIAAFYAIDSAPPGLDNAGSASAGPGITRMARNFSTSYQNFLSLYLLYKSNAGIWTQDYINPSTPQVTKVNLATLGSIYLYYDHILYIGSFDNFSITESDEAPYALEYSFSFTVRAWFVLDTQQDPQLAFQPPVSTTPKQGITPQAGTAPTQSDPEATALNSISYGANVGQSGGGPVSQLQETQTQEAEREQFGATLGGG